MVQPIILMMAMLVLTLVTTSVSQKSPREVVDGFLKTVRSGLHPERAGDYMADTILAHQLTAEKPATIRRTPADYADHVKDFQRLFGNYELEITELLAEGNKVYVRWIQSGRHLAEMDGYAPTGLPLIEITSVVYRVEKEKIVEYWLQTDRLGFEFQLRQNKQTASTK